MRSNESGLTDDKVEVEEPVVEAPATGEPPEVAKQIAYERGQDDHPYVHSPV